MNYHVTVQWNINHVTVKILLTKSLSARRVGTYGSQYFPNRKYVCKLCIKIMHLFTVGKEMQLNIIF